MKLRSSKAALYLGTIIAMCLMPIVPVIADATTTYEQQESTSLKRTVITASYTENVSDIVAQGYQKNQETGMYEGKAIALTDSYIVVYSEADENSQPVGRMYNESIADSIIAGTEWTKISSGTLSGFVKTSQLCFDEEAESIATQSGTVTSTVNVDSANVYSSPDSSDVVFTAQAGEQLQAIAKNGNYVKVETAEGNTGYIDSAQQSLDYGLETALNNEQVQEKEAAEAAAEEAARVEAERVAAEQEAARVAAEEAQKAEEAKKQSAIASAQVTYNPTMSVSDDEVWLLACIIDWEAANESYQGKLAVANVVLNRVRSSQYASGITGVIYQQGQFSGVTSSAFSARVSSGPTSSDSMKAALEALSGVNNIGSYTNFRTTAIANYSAYSSYTVIGNHCFY